MGREWVGERGPGCSEDEGWGLILAMDERAFFRLALNSGVIAVISVTGTM